MIKHVIKFDIDKIKVEINELSLSQPFDRQLLIQSVDGTNWHDVRAPYKIHEDLRDKDFSIPNTPDNFELTRFMKESGIVRTRILKLNQFQCYTYHKDYGTRLHLAVDTNDQCFFIENYHVFHIPADGYGYEVDTNNYHTAMNCSREPLDRVHVVGIFR
tara:strand:+ start:403 stop:879 length:477 start_codon:yes stop_codon:yes gene_type:complete